MKKNKKESQTKENRFMNRIRPVVSDDREDWKESETREYEEGDENPQSVKQRLQKNGLLLRNIAIVVVVVCVLRFLLVDVLFGASYNGYEVVEDTDITNANMTDYVSYQDSIIKYSRDGVTYVDENGEAVWTETYAMKMPVADVCEDYIAIGDLNGNDVYIFDKEGKVSSCTMPYTICDISVAGQGAFAVVLQGKTDSFINIYDKDGNQIMERKTSLDQNGYPLDIDLSVDGQKLFSSSLSVNEKGQMESKLTASNFGEVGQNENADRIVGGYLLQDTVVPKVEFLDNNTVCAFGDDRFFIYNMKERSDEKTVITFDTEIQSVIFNSQYIGVVLLNTEKDAEEPYILKLYNTNGREVLSKKIEVDYDNVQMRGEDIIFTGGKECKIYTIEGKEKFSYAFSKPVKDLVPTGSSRQYIVLYENGSEVIRLKHKSVKE